MSAGLTLDGLFRRAGVRNAHEPALLDPPHRATFTDGATRALDYAQADRAIAAFAATLRSLGLHTGTVVGLQLPNTVERVIAFLGIVRAGMVAALGRAGAKAIVTAARIGGTRHAELAMEVAAELFPIRQICAFGDNLPDGVVPLDGVFAGLATEPPPRRAGEPSTQVVAKTFYTSADGIVSGARGRARRRGAGGARAEGR